MFWKHHLYFSKDYVFKNFKYISCFHFNAFLKNFHFKILIHKNKNFYGPIKNARLNRLKKYNYDKSYRVQYFCFTKGNFNFTKSYLFFVKTLVMVNLINFSFNISL